MTLRFLLDTNILSEPLRPQPNSDVLQKLRQHRQVISTASVVIHEILFGCYRLPQDSRKRRDIEGYINQSVRSQIPIFGYDLDAAIWFARERARLTSMGKTPAYADGQIAAIAQVNNLTLVTNNVSDYADFADLKLENWFISLQ
jgi:tRNA(fMet)-specific endonuclease VapC